MEYSLFTADTQHKRLSILALRALTEILGNAYDRLKQMASKASARKTQLILFNLSSEIYKYYLEIVSQVQILERQFFYPLKTENYPNEFYVVHFHNMPKNDNTEELFHDCAVMIEEIQQFYNKLISESPTIELKKLLEHQLNEILRCFLKLKINN